MFKQFEADTVPLIKRKLYVAASVNERRERREREEEIIEEEHHNTITALEQVHTDLKNRETYLCDIRKISKQFFKIIRYILF